MADTTLPEREGGLREIFFATHGENVSVLFAESERRITSNSVDPRSDTAWRRPCGRPRYRRGKGVLALLRPRETRSLFPALRPAERREFSGRVRPWRRGDEGRARRYARREREARRGVRGEREDSPGERGDAEGAGRGEDLRLGLRRATRGGRLRDEDHRSSAGGAAGRRVAAEGVGRRQVCPGAPGVLR